MGFGGVGRGRQRLPQQRFALIVLPGQLLFQRQPNELRCRRLRGSSRRGCFRGLGLLNEHEKSDREHYRSFPSQCEEP